MSEIFMCKDVSSLMRPQRIHVVSIIQKTNLQIFVPHIKTFNIPTLIQKTFFLIIHRLCTTQYQNLQKYQPTDYYNITN